MESCDKLLPGYLRFVRGLVDSEDLPLNVSREMLQEHSALTSIRRQLTRKVLKLLEGIAKDKPETYEKVWDNYGAVLKEGIHTDSTHHDDLVELLRYRTSADDKLVSLAQYVESMPEGQPAIYYITGESLAAVARSPHLEACRARGYQVLYMADPIDEWVVQDLSEYKGKKLISVTQGDLDIPEDEAHKHDAGAIAAAVDKSKELLTDKVKDVRVSKRLRRAPPASSTTAAACRATWSGSSRWRARTCRPASGSSSSTPSIRSSRPSTSSRARPRATTASAPTSSSSTTRPRSPRARSPDPAGLPQALQLACSAARSRSEPRLDLQQPRDPGRGALRAFAAGVRAGRTCLSGQDDYASPPASPRERGQPEQRERTCPSGHVIAAAAALAARLPAGLAGRIAALAAAAVAAGRAARDLRPRPWPARRGRGRHRPDSLALSPVPEDSDIAAGAAVGRRIRPRRPSSSRSSRRRAY